MIENHWKYLGKDPLKYSSIILPGFLDYKKRRKPQIDYLLDNNSTMVFRKTNMKRMEFSSSFWSETA